MAVGRDLYLAILALDSYNRDYDQVVNLTGTQIGDARILSREADLGLDSAIFETWKSRGFYGIAYDTGGTSIGTSLTLSYRGTNFNFPSLWDFLNSPGVLDALNGWSVFFGDTEGQAALALDLYVAAAGPWADLRGASITTTGHSLGGGLAGLVAETYNRGGLLFDHMPYGDTVAELIEQATESQDLRDRYYQGALPWLPSATSIGALSTEGEFLAALRLSLDGSIPSHGGLRSPVTLHSMALLVDLIWARDNARTDWQPVGKQLWNAYFDAAIADTLSVPASLIGPTGAAATVLQSAIAYSALDSGERPFGDTAIWAMFDDADELGTVIGGTPAGFFDAFVQFDVGLFQIYKDVKQTLADFVVQYAGALAINDIEGNDDAKQGVLSLSDDEQILTFDASKPRWEDLIGSPVEPINLENFRDAFFAQTDAGWIDTLLRWTGLRSLEDIAKVGWQADTADIFDRYHMRTRDDVTSITLPERTLGTASGTGNAARVDVVVGGAASETIRGTTGNDLIFGSGGADSIDAGDGIDVINAGSGADTITGGGGKNLLIGGDGNDTLTYQGGAAGNVLTIVISPDIADEGFGLIDQLTVQVQVQGVNASDDPLDDLVFGTETLQLGDGADDVLIRKENQFDLFRDPLVIDLGAPTGAGGDGDILRFGTRDLLFFEDQGVFYRNGYIQTAVPGSGLLYSATSILLAAQPRAVQGLLLAEDFLVPDDKVQFKGVDNVELTDRDDRFILDSGDEGTHSGSGEIKGFKGNDVFYVTHVPNGDLTLDAGEGNDIVIVTDGQAVVTAGGLGRDVIINTSEGGQLYGDLVNGTLVDENGIVGAVPDTGDNADHFWFAPGTTILDPQKNDILSFYGVPLTGGDASATSVAWALAGPTGAISGAIQSGFSFFSVSVMASTFGLLKTYFDTWLPNIVYLVTETADQNGRVKMAIINQTDLLFRLATGGQALPTQQDFGDNRTSLTGVQVIRNFDFEAGNFGLGDGLFFDELSGLSTYTRTIANDTGSFGMLFNFPSIFGVIMGGLGVASELIKLTPAIGMVLQVYEKIALVDSAAWLAGAALRLAKNMAWAVGVDPLVIDLDGDGLETRAVDDGQVFFDFDNDLFSNLTGWVARDDGFLIRDLNDNGRIDNIGEMFGNQFEGGYLQLAQHDAAGNGGNGDGRITAADAIWSELLVWRDRDGDGVTDAGELLTLDALGIVSIRLDAQALDIVTPQGTRLIGTSEIELASGATRRMYEAIFETVESYSRFAGEAGRAPWQSDLKIDAKGIGSVTNLAIAAANDVELGEILATVAAAMTEPDFLQLRKQAGPVLSYWGQTLETTRELMPVLLGQAADGKVTLADRGVYVEDAAGGFWALASGAPVRDADGNVIGRPTLEQVLGQATGSGQHWQLEQAWSPASRGAELQFREPAPYLMRVVDGRAVIDDYGIRNVDGSWRLASGRTILDVDGNPIAAPTVADILAQARATGQEWRTEEIGFNPYADLPVDVIAVRITDGITVDYSVEVTDQDGTFHVWARNLDRALELQFKTGDSREFNLRNYALDFDTLDEIGVSDDSTYRVELLTPGQFHFATSLAGLDFRPEMLTATLDGATGLIDYRIVEGGSYSLSEEEYQSVIDPMIEMVGLSMTQYLLAASRLAVRMALQGGLSDFARELTYDVETDKYRPTGEHELAPMFQAIFEGAPPTNDNDAVHDYFAAWALILSQVYPDYSPRDPDYIFDTKLGVDQPFVFQMLLAAYETVPVDLDLVAVANAFGIEERKIVEHRPTDTVVRGHEGANFFVLSEGAQTVIGSYDPGAQEFRRDVQADIYYVGADSGDDYIYDLDLGDTDQLRLALIDSEEVKAVRDGEDLILFYDSGTRFIRLVDQFLGELNPILDNGTRLQTGVDDIVFADGVVWNRYRMAFAVVDFDRAAMDEADAHYGSGSGDIFFSGLGNDYLSGGAGGDTYIFQPGDGHDVIDDLGNFSFGPIQAGMDFLMFRGDITEDTVRLTRDGPSENLVITILDAEGNPTGDSLELVGQFGGVRLNLGAFSELIGADDGLDFIAPNLIEKIIFEKGSTLDYATIVERVIANAKTDGDDAIYGLLNDNTLDGGRGDDFLTGREGVDTYLYGRDYGSDVVLDSDFSSSLFGPKLDILRFTDDLRWTDIAFLRDGSSDTLRLQVAGTDDQLVLTDYLEYILLVGYIHLVETIEFGDGTVWNHLKLLQHYVDIARTDAADTIYGFETIADRIDGGLGNDRLEGMSAGDTYVFAAGHGIDTVLDTEGDDRIEFQNLLSGDIEFSRTALDLIMTIRGTGDRIVLENQYVREGQQQYAVELFQFGDRTLVFTDFNPEDIDLVGTGAGETIAGSNFAETIDSRGGDDVMVGNDGGDTYLFDVGYGQDTISDVRVRAAWQDRRGVIVPKDDVVRFGDDITQANVVFTRDGNDLVISVADRPDTLRIRNQFLDVDNGVERFEFADGGFMLISDVEEALQIEGGNRGDNVITGSLSQPNTLDGRQGDDTLIGGNQGDIYAFGADYDFDRIVERPDVPGVVDLVQFGATVTRDVMKVSRDGNDLVIDLGNGSDVLTIADGLAGRGVEAFRFADATVLTLDAIIDRMLTGAAGDEQLLGFDARDDTIWGAGGSDALIGGDGNDTYRFGYGDGTDSILDAGGVDRLVFGPGVTADLVTFATLAGDLLVTLAGTGERIAVLGGYRATAVESFVFEDGTTLSIAEVREIIRQSGSNESQDILDTGDFAAGRSLEPGGQHDRVILAQGGVVVFNAGDGIDRFEMAPGATSATILLPDAPSNTVSTRLADGSSDDLVVSLASGDQLVISGALGAGAIPTIAFGNGVSWGVAQLVQAWIDGQATPGDDVARGSDRADTIEGGRGDDQLRGARGDDLYRFSRGDGQDVIEDEQGFDRLQLVGYRPDEVRVERLGPGRDDLLLTFAESDDLLIIRGAALESVDFSNGISWTRDALLDLVNAVGSEFDDLLIGTGGDENYRPGFGNDRILDGAGNDVYAFSRGDGQDRIEARGAVDGFGVIRFGAGIALEDVTAKRDADGNLILTIAGGDDRLVLVDPLADPDAIVGTLAFADGRTLSIATLSRAIPATDGDDHVIVPSGATNPGGGSGAELFGLDGNDTIEAGRGADILTGGRGDDLLQGHSGADTYFFARGDGQDTIADVEGVATGVVDRIRFAAGITAGDIRILSVGPRDLEIGIAGSDDRITIRDMFAAVGRDGRIEEFAFANGTAWSLAEILALAGTGGAGDDTIDFGTQLALDLVLDGGAGDDRLAGGPGDTTYVFDPGDGRDEIIEAGYFVFSTDTLRFGAGIDAAALVAVRHGNDLLLRFAGSEDEVLVRNQFAVAAVPIDHVLFADGTALTAADLDNLLVTEDAAQRLLHPSVPDANPFTDPLFARLHAGDPGDGGGGSGGGGGGTGGFDGQPRTLTGTPGAVDVFEFFVPLVDDGAGLVTILGFETGDLGDKLDIRLGAGLSGEVVARQEGTDTYIYFVDDGVHGLDAAWLLIRLQGIDAASLSLGNFNGAPFASAVPQTISGTAAAESLTGGWGTDTLLGNDGADTLTGGTGSDLLSGGNQSDLYRFGLGFGQDVVSDNGWSNQ
ncbi:calcium-binding protein, partial [Falsiroseomonas oryzae]|uniref:calcium-binding protein n=1 Tax=Falsiroseomonas oryzae TaxID=2766473 RepID=UPI0022EB2AF5